MKNHGHKGDAAWTLKAGEKMTLVDCEGPGILQQMWFTYDRYRHSNRIRVGRYLGTNVLMRDGEGNHATWFGEGEVKIYLDGDEEYPTLAGTGTEDYILTAFGQGEFSNLYSGCTMFKEDEDGCLVTAFYRLHIPNPVYSRRIVV